MSPTPLKKILIIEDNPAIARGLSDILAGENFTPRTCSGGEKGLEVAFSEKPEVVLLDIGLPDINGFDVLKQLRLRGFQNPVLMLTSRSDRIDKISALEAGADDYITKPFDIREVVARVKANVHRAEQLMARSEAADGKRKLLAIMFTDMKDFSKIMNEDEDDALSLLRHHNSVMDAAIPEHEGRIIEIIGDAYLAAFESSEHAVDCALAIQKQFFKYNKENPEGRNIAVRIGIHLGDVVQYGEKLRGNAVNVAARIQEVAEPGNVYVSEQVVLATRKKKEYNFISLGPRNLKNIEEAVHIFRIS